MSLLASSTSRRYGDTWVQMQCDDCGAKSPRVEVDVPRRGPVPEKARALAKHFAGFVEHLRPWYTKAGRRGNGMAVHDLCRACAYKAMVHRLVADLGGPFDRRLPAADGTYSDLP